MRITDYVNTDIIEDVVETMLNDYTCTTALNIINNLEGQFEEVVFLKGGVPNINYENLLISGTFLKSEFGAICLAILEKQTEEKEISSIQRVMINGVPEDFVIHSFMFYFGQMLLRTKQIIESSYIVFDMIDEVKYQILEKAVELYNEANSSDFTLHDFIANEKKEEIVFYIENARVMEY